MNRILVVGAGFAGLWSAIAAARLRAMHRRNGDTAEFEIVVVAPSDRLTVRPRLYEEDVASLTHPLGPVFAAVGARFVQARAEQIDVEGSGVRVTDLAGQTETLGYDRLVLATGSRLRDPGIPGFREYAFSIDQLHEAEQFEQHLCSLADQSADRARDTVVVVGGGFTGLEIAAELPARLRRILGPASRPRVFIVERADEIGPDLGLGPRSQILDALAAHGIELQLGRLVTSIDADGVTTDAGERLSARTVLWTGGLAASALAENVPGPHDRLGRLIVDQDLRVPAAPQIFATGDTASVATDALGHNALMSCQHALTLGRYAGHNAAADLLEIPTLPYRQPRYVTFLDLGPDHAVATEGWERTVRMTGLAAKEKKRRVNTQAIVPPAPERDLLFAAADPLSASTEA